MGNTLSDYSISLKCKDPSRVHLCGDFLEGEVTVTLPSKRKVPPGCLNLTLLTNLRYYVDEPPRLESTVVEPLTVYHFPLRVPAQPDGQISLKAGKSVLPFAFEIPPNLPAHIFCHYGIPVVSHSLWVTLDKAKLEGRANGGAEGLRDSVGLMIYPRVSILDNPSLLQPSTTRGNRTYIGLELSMEQTAFVPGQVIALHMKISNKNRHTIKSCTISFIQEYAAHTVKGQRKILEVSQFDAGHPRNEELIDEYCSLTIPHRALQPSYSFVGGIGHTFSVSVGYRLEVQVTVRGLFNPPIVANQPILIGTEPTVHEMARQWLDLSRRETMTPFGSGVDANLYPTIDPTELPPSYNSIYPEASAPPEVADKADGS